MADQFLEVKPVNDKMYQKNMKALSVRYPEYAKRVEETEMYVKYRTFRTGEKKTVNLYSVERSALYYDYENPLKDAETNIQQLNLINVKLAIILGFGLSYEIDCFAKNIMSKNGTRGVVIIEKELEIFKIMIHFLDITEIINNRGVLLILGADYADVLPCFERFIRQNGELLYYFSTVKFVYHTTNFAWFKDYYMTLIGTIKEAMNYLMKFYGNDPGDSLIGIENMMDNINEIIYNPGVNMLYDKFKGKPAIVVATGPSLNKNKHLLGQVQNNAVIIAADASLKVLMKDGLKPHLVTALERQGRVDQLLQGFEYEQVKDIYFAGTPVIQRKVYDLFPAPRIIVYRNFDHFKWLQIDKGTLNIKQSSGNMAFKIADALGCNPIILVGQDLAYSRDGYTHAEGAVLGSKQTFRSGDLEVMGNDGQPIMTNQTWNNFRKAYEIDIIESDKRVINCTEGGAYIRGTEVMTLAEAIDAFMKNSVNPLETIVKETATFNETIAEQTKSQLAVLFEKTEVDLSYMLDEALAGLEIIKENKSFLESVVKGDVDDNPKVMDLFNQITVKRKNIFSVQPTMQLYLMHVIQSYNIKFENDIYGFFDTYHDRQKAYAAIILENIKWFAIFHDLTKLSKNALEIGANRIKEDYVTVDQR